jgi:hypothetical protein
MKTKPEPDFDLNLVEGKQAEFWVDDIRKALGGSAEVEVKAPKPWLKEQSFYVEYECKKKAGWSKSGIATTKAKIWLIKFGSLPGGLVVETEWLRRAGRLSYKRGKIKECQRGSHPTRGVTVSLRELWETREHEP